MSRVEDFVSWNLAFVLRVWFLWVYDLSLRVLWSIFFSESDLSPDLTQYKRNSLHLNIFLVVELGATRCENHRTHNTKIRIRMKTEMKERSTERKWKRNQRTPLLRLSLIRNSQKNDWHPKSFSIKPSKNHMESIEAESSWGQLRAVCPTEATPLTPAIRTILIIRLTCWQCPFNGSIDLDSISTASRWGVSSFSLYVREIHVTYEYSSGCPYTVKRHRCRNFGCHRCCVHYQEFRALLRPLRAVLKKFRWIGRTATTFLPFTSDVVLLKLFIALNWLLVYKPFLFAVING